MNLGVLIFLLILLTECNTLVHAKTHVKMHYFLNKRIIDKAIYKWNHLIHIASQKYDIDEKLIKSVIYAESSGNPYSKSHSNAIGLMQIKPNSAGLEIYRINGKKGQPSVESLYNPKININIGTAYFNLLKKRLFGIKDKEIMKRAMLVSYVNGESAFIKIFSKNKKEAIKIINTMTIDSFSQYIKKNTPQNKHIFI